eukprot:s856_g16.t1
MIPGTEEDNAPPVLGAALQSLSEVPENECYTLGVLSQGQCTCQEDLCDAHVFDERFCSMTCTCASSEWCLPVEREQPYDVHPYTECDTDTTSNLRQLRLKLDSLRDRQHERAAGASPRKRSSMEQLAARRKAHPRTLPQQPVCNMENLLPVRLEGGVHSEGGLQGDVPTSGAEKHRFGDGHRGDSNGDGSLGGDGEVRQRQVHGSGRQGYNVTTREPMVRKTPGATSSTTPLPRTPTKTTTPTTTGMMEDRVLKGSQPKAIAMKKSPIENSKGNGAQGSGVSPVNLTNEQIHQSLCEISQLELRMQAQWEKLMEEEEDADSWDAGQAELIENRKGQLAPSGED